MATNALIKLRVRRMIEWVIRRSRIGPSGYHACL
jgi:hypothetical protein